MVAGVAIGSLMHNVIPQNIITKYVGDSNLWVVPIAAIIGIPLYVSSSTILPIGMALAGAGVGFGASIPEIILLNKMFKKELIIAFVVSIFVIAISAGYLVQFLL